jgi:integrase
VRKVPDIDFERQRIHIRRAYVNGGIATPKNGKGRFVAMAPGLEELLLEVLATRRREILARGWATVPDWVFPSETGGPLHLANFQRTWKRIQRRAQKTGVRTPKLHTTRHTWASTALGAGKSVRWVADQLGHSSPTLTLKTYAHALREEEVDLSFAEFGSSKRPYATPPDLKERNEEDAPDLTGRGRSRNLEHETGLEPATST